MKHVWDFNELNISRVRHLVQRLANCGLVVARKRRNLATQRPSIDRDEFWLKFVASLLTTQQRSGPNAPTLILLGLIRSRYLPFNSAQPLRLPALRETLAERVIDESSLARMIDLEPVARNAMMILVMYAADIRVSELVGLRWKDCQPRSNGEGQITVFGKGQKTRSILVGTNVFTRLMSLRGRASNEASVFASRKGHGRLNTSHVLRITKRAARPAGIVSNVRNHDLWHSHASHSLERGASIALVSRTLGHASISTTGRYLHARPGDSSSRYLGLWLIGRPA